MKKIIGIVITLLSLALIGISILRIWNIEIISLKYMVKSSVTLLFIGLAILILIILYGALLKNNSQVYNKNKGKQAHPKQ